ncbi:MAG: N-acetyltransferase [Mariprofundaceae bacterium]|nr:N-acetyltransferase [Mariprofundaceae bacterium]
MAEADDVDVMHALLLPWSEKKIVLPRTHDSLYQHLQEFVVAEYDGKVVGLVALHVYQSNLAEVRSLVVSESYQGMGIGKLLVEACEKVAAGLGLEKVFALTYVTGFFAHMGYQVVPKESLPHKIWTACIHCEKFSSCDEIAMKKQLSSVPAETAPIIEVKQA